MALIFHLSGMSCKKKETAQGKSRDDDVLSCHATGP